MMKAQQLLGDGRLEWISFSGLSSLGTEQVFEAFGKRIHQGKGPFRLEFNQALKPSERVYFQIDGEFYQMTSPKAYASQYIDVVTSKLQFSNRYCDVSGWIFAYSEKFECWRTGMRNGHASKLIKTFLADKLWWSRLFSIRMVQ